MKPWLILAALLSLSLSACQPSPPELKDMGLLKNFGEGFVDEKKQPISAATFKGRPWVANFMFTSCPSSCPPLATATSKLQEKIKAWAPADQGPSILTITVDPVTDTPELLSKFGDKYKADPKVWRFAVGEYDAMEKLVVEGFYSPVVRSDVGRGETLAEREAMLKTATPIDTGHSLHFVLVDGEGRLRGIFGKEDKDLDKINAALRALSQ